MSFLLAAIAGIYPIVDFIWFEEFFERYYDVETWSKLFVGIASFSFIGFALPRAVDWVIRGFKSDATTVSAQNKKEGTVGIEPEAPTNKAASTSPAQENLSPKHILWIQAKSVDELYPAVKQLCADLGMMKYIEAKKKLTEGVILPFSTEADALSAAVKYQNLGCSATYSFLGRERKRLLPKKAPLGISNTQKDSMRMRDGGWYLIATGAFVIVGGFLGIVGVGVSIFHIMFGSLFVALGIGVIIGYSYLLYIAIALWTFGCIFDIFFFITDIMQHRESKALTGILIRIGMLGLMIRATPLYTKLFSRRAKTSDN